MFERFLHTVLRFARDRSASAMVYMALAALPMVGFVGIGTDVARAYLVKSRLSSALDAAALAGGRTFFLPTRDADVHMYFDANFTPGYMGSTLSGPTIVANESAETLELFASATINTSFMRVLGYDALTVSAETEVTREMVALDVVLAIDMSGSMGRSAGDGGSRIEAARTAAFELTGILFGDDATKDLLNIGLVPWNGKVNVQVDGTVYDSDLTVAVPVDPFTHPVTGAAQAQVFQANNSPVPLLDAPDEEWAGCVFARFADDGDDATDADVLFGPATLATIDWPAWEPIGPEGEPIPSWPDCAMNIGGTECTPCPVHGITPLQNVRSVIDGAVDDLRRPRGVTDIPQGMAWAWRVLKPGAPFTEAVLDPDYRRQQAIVLLTDGENVGGPGDGYKAVFGTGGAARPEMDARLRILADNIKADGVIVYVIQFANAGGALQALLEDVASGPDAPYYNYAPDGAALRRIFREIANHLSELRLSR